MTWVHNLDPFAIQFTETFGIRWYGLAYLMGLITGYAAIYWFVRKGRTPFKLDQIADFTTYCAIGVLGGGRLGYCIFYSPELLFSFDASFPFWGVLKVNEGGMASHGGILGVLAVCYFYGRAKKISWMHCLDMTTFGGALGFFFGRLANFVNGELYGRPSPEGLSWAVKFPQEMGMWVQQRDFAKMLSLQPVVDALKQFKTSAGEIVQVNGAQWQVWVNQYGTDYPARIKVHETIEAVLRAIQNHNPEVTAAAGQVLTARYPSQLIQAMVEGLLVFIALLILWRKPQKPGVIAASFGSLYCVARIIGEQFRMPDAQIGFQLWGLTRGQWISFGMLAVGLLFLYWAWTRPALKLGGWAKLSPLEEKAVAQALKGRK